MDNRAIEHIFYSIENNLNTNDYINIIKEKLLYQKNAEELLKGFQKIANINKLSVHIHNFNRPGEECLIVEDVNRIKQLFGETIKHIPSFKHKIIPRYKVKRLILSFLKDKGWGKTSEIYTFLERNGINLSRRSSVLINKHLNKLWKGHIIEKKLLITLRNNKGQFIKSECEWRLSQFLTEKQIMNFPYGVLK